MLALLRTKFLLPTFYVFSESFQKNVKSHAFLKSEKNDKYVFSNTAPHSTEWQRLTHTRIAVWLRSLFSSSRLAV